VDQDEAVGLIRGASVEAGSTWADLGAGAGTFTRAIASLIGAGGTVYAVDRDAGALRGLARAGHDAGAAIRVVVADFTDRLDLPLLDGVVLANALHYVPYVEQRPVLERVSALVGETGSIVVVEYERRDANRWVPYPISFDALGVLAAEAGLTVPARLASRPSRYTGSIYSALVRRRVSPR
jgi:SAM-dependent methyltransferase